MLEHLSHDPKDMVAEIDHALSVSPPEVQAQRALDAWRETWPAPRPGSLMVWHIPQVPGKSFRVPVATPEEAVSVLRALGQYDLFLLANDHRCDYASANDLMEYIKEPGHPAEVDSSGVANADGFDWVEWYHPETGEDIRQYGDRLEEEASVADDPGALSGAPVE